MSPYTLLLLPIFTILIGCGDKGNNPKSAKKMTPEECYNSKYAEFRQEREKELKDSGDKGPFAEQELVPGGMRQMIEEDCKDGIYDGN